MVTNPEHHALDGLAKALARGSLSRRQEATREAELRTAVHGALKTTDYDALTVGEISKRLDGLSTAELRKVREYEKQNKNRETLIEQIDRKIKANS